MPGARAEASLIHKYLWVLNWTVLFIMNAYSKDWLNSKQGSQWEAVDLPALEVRNKSCKYCLQFLEYSSGWGCTQWFPRPAPNLHFHAPGHLPLQVFHLGCKDLCVENMDSQIWYLNMDLSAPSSHKAFSVTVWTDNYLQDPWQDPAGSRQPSPWIVQGWPLQYLSSERSSQKSWLDF